MKTVVITILHLVYWLLYLSIVSTVVNAFEYDSLMMFWMIDQFIFTSRMGVMMIVPGFIAFYFSYFLFFNKYYSKRKLGGLVVNILLVSLIFSALTVGALYLYSYKATTYQSKALVHMITYLILQITVLGLIHAFLGLALRGFIRGYIDMKEKQELSMKNNEMELALLKAQINPHFLFNTINNIDVLIKKDADKASQYLNKLSQMMRFMLYETNTEKIDLKTELSYIESYIELQKIRTTNGNYVNYDIKGKPDDVQIEPMLFIPFIENAFKHAENKKVDNAVSIKFDIEKDKIQFECENAYSTETQLKPAHSGLGNDLIKRRLALLYPNNHTFTVEDKNGFYKVALSIILKK